MMREEKEAFVSRMKDEVAKAQSVLFVDFTGLTVEEVNTFRGNLREVGIRYEVVKNTLMKRAIAGTDYEGASTWLKDSPTGVVLGFEDPVAPAKLTYEMLKKVPKHLRVKGGIFENKPIDEKQVEELSNMPSKEELQAQVVQLALSPGRNLAGQIKSPGGKIVGAIESLVERLEKAG